MKYWFTGLFVALATLFGSTNNVEANGFGRFGNRFGFNNRFAFGHRVGFGFGGFGYPVAASFGYGYPVAAGFSYPVATPVCAAPVAYVPPVAEVPVAAPFAAPFAAPVCAPIAYAAPAFGVGTYGVGVGTYGVGVGFGHSFGHGFGNRVFIRNNRFGNRFSFSVSNRFGNRFSFSVSNRFGNRFSFRVRR